MLACPCVPNEAHGERRFLWKFGEGSVRHPDPARQQETEGTAALRFHGWCLAQFGSGAAAAARTVKQA
jgi:hypothetical protein